VYWVLPGCLNPAYYGHVVGSDSGILDKYIIIGTNNRWISRHRRLDRVKDQHSSRKSKKQTSTENIGPLCCHKDDTTWHNFGTVSTAYVLPQLHFCATCQLTLFRAERIWILIFNGFSLSTTNQYRFIFLHRIIRCQEECNNLSDTHLMSFCQQCREMQVIPSRMAYSW